MYCSTCGTRVPMDAARCGECGALLRPTVPVPSPAAAAIPARRALDPAAIGRCRRCGYRGEGVAYFSRGGHVTALVGLAMITAGAMGVGGIVYYFLRRDHQICPRCHASWGRPGERALAHTAADAPEASAADPVFAHASSSKQGASIALFLLGAMLAVGGILDTSLPPILLAGVATAGGLLLHRAAERDRIARRAALLASLQPQVIQLAARSRAQLTVTQVAGELGWTLRRAEKVLQSLDDGVRVSSEVTDEGVIVYEFRELARSLGGPV